MVCALSVEDSVSRIATCSSSLRVRLQTRATSKLAAIPQSLMRGGRRHSRRHDAQARVGYEASDAFNTGALKGPE
jgi:hypothetical protein